MLSHMMSPHRATAVAQSLAPWNKESLEIMLDNVTWQLDTLQDVAKTREFAGFGTVLHEMTMSMSCIDTNSATGWTIQHVSSS